MDIKERIRKLSNQYHSEIVACRRHLHQHPELSFQETETQKFVENKLREFGVSDVKRMVGTGLVALVRGKNPEKKTVALRADMDALPIIETNNKEYKSQNVGVM